MNIEDTILMNYKVPFLERKLAEKNLLKGKVLIHHPGLDSLLLLSLMQSFIHESEARSTRKKYQAFSRLPNDVTQNIGQYWAKYW